VSLLSRAAYPHLSSIVCKSKKTTDMVRPKSNPLRPHIALQLAATNFDSVGSSKVVPESADHPSSLGTSSSALISRESIQHTYASLFSVSSQDERSKLTERISKTIDFSQSTTANESSGTGSLKGGAAIREEQRASRNQMNRYIRFYSEIIDILPVSAM